jgi:hypothetical protein
MLDTEYISVAILKLINEGKALPSAKVDEYVNVSVHKDVEVKGESAIVEAPDPIKYDCDAIEDGVITGVLQTTFKLKDELASFPFGNVPVNVIA